MRHRPIRVIASLAAGLDGFPLFSLRKTCIPGVVFVAMLPGAVVRYPIFGIHAACLTDLLPTKLCSRGITPARKSACAVFGGPLPLLAAVAAVAAAGGKPWPVSVIKLVMGCTSAPCRAVLALGAGEAGFHAARDEPARLGGRATRSLLCVRRPDRDRHA